MGCSTPCEKCPTGQVLVSLGTGADERVVALAGNPNTGKSTVFNALTGLRQHTGNWPGKTVTRAEGAFAFQGKRYRLVDLPGTYSLLSASVDEEIARDFLLFGQPDCTIVVVDSTALQRNLNLALQVLEVTDKVVVCCNLMDEARRRGLSIDVPRLAQELGVPVIPAAARQGEGIDELLEAVAGIIDGRITTSPRLPATPEYLRASVHELIPMIGELVPGVPNARWIAYRLLEGDLHLRQAIETGELARIIADNGSPVDAPSPAGDIETSTIVELGA